MVLAAVGFFLIILLALAVVLDVGWWLHDKRDAQNDVDATVLAGARELPDEGTARALAETWAARNGVTSGDLNCCQFEDLSGDGAADLIRARVEREPGSLAGRLLDIGIVTIAAEAAAAKQHAIGSCVIPWAVVGDQEEGAGGYWGLTPEALFGFHTSDFLTPGNFGALALYGNGAVAYRDAIVIECGDADSVCDQLGDPVVPINGTLECDVQTGSMGQNTHQALTDRDIAYGVEDNDCDVHSYEDAETQAGLECGDSRAVPIPIIDAFPSEGHDAIHILGSAVFYIAGWDRSGPWGDVDMDSDTVDDMVWGYFLQDQDVAAAWNIQWGYNDDPFAPTRILLVE